MGVLLRCIDLEKRYYTKQSGAQIDNYALKDVSFELKEGDRLGLVGLNGSGKSTLLKIIANIIKPSGGRVELFKKVHCLSSFDSILHQDMTARENIVFQLGLMDYSTTQIEYAIQEIADFSELKDFIDEPVKYFSSGMMLRLSFSIFKIIQPEILLLDEVFSAGDLKFQKKADSLFKEHFNRVSGIIMASHQLSEIVDYCNYCLILNKGKIEFKGKVDDAINHYIDLNRTKPKNILENELLKIEDVGFVAASNTFMYSEEIELEFEYLKKTDQRVDVVLYVSNNYCNVLSDSALYRIDCEERNYKAGLYKVLVTIPSCVVNKGKYYIDIVFGDGQNDILSLKDILSFNVIPDKWESDKLWNINPRYPIRTKLKWTESYSR